MNCLILINIYTYIYQINITNNNGQFYEHSNAEQ